MTADSNNGPSKLDELDHRIVGALRMNGRKGNSELARELGVTETTIRRRLQRLMEQDYVRVVAVTNPRRIGYEYDVVVALDVDIYHLEDVAKRLAEQPEVRFVGCVTGNYNIHFVALFRSGEEFHEFLSKKLAALPGIRKVETAHVVKVHKRTYDRVEADGAVST